MHWSMLAYTGMVKILKKHHKKTGTTVQSVHIETLVTQPFYSPEICQGLIQRVETAICHLQQLYPELAVQQAAEGMVASRSEQSEAQGEPQGQGQHIVDCVQENLEQIGRRKGQGADITHQTQVALATWERLRSSAATPSTVLQPQPQQSTSRASSQGEQDET